MSHNISKRVSAELATLDIAQLQVSSVTRVRAVLASPALPLPIVAPIVLWLLGDLLSPGLIAPQIAIGLSPIIVVASWVGRAHAEKIAARLEENGDFEAAIVAYIESVSSKRGLVRIRSLLGLATALMRAQRFREAKRLFDALYIVGIRGFTGEGFAGSLACEALLDMPHSPKIGQLHVEPSRSTTLHSLAAIVWAKHGEFDELRTTITPLRFLFYRKRLASTHEGRVFALLRAFTAHNSRTIGRWKSLAAPRFAGEYDYLTARWPELASFVGQGTQGQALLPRAEAVPSKC